LHKAKEAGMRRSGNEENGMNARTETDVIASLIAAVNRHDLDGLVGLFAADVRSDAPAHPSRSFVGSDQVRRNWGQILGAIHDLEAHLVSSATVGGRVWAELEFRGHRSDGGAWLLRGVTINDVVDASITGVRFYMEPVDLDGIGVDTSVARIVGSVAAGTPAAAGASR
jgi:SnoaL-like domain